jgi:hypothetical protein
VLLTVADVKNVLQNAGLAREFVTWGKGDRVKKVLIGALALGFACLSAWAEDLAAAKGEGSPAPMRFEWRMEGPADQCGKSCRTWISAVGVITESTARDFEAFAKTTNVQGATVALYSEGGSVRAALALGRAIRRFDMATTVGKTTPLPTAGATMSRATMTPEAYCESMCAFVLLGGARRFVPAEARILVHQIWLGDKSRRALEASYTAEELDLVQRDIGSIARYTIEMGGSIELLETALRVPPWKPMHALSTSEIRRMRLTTSDRVFDTAPPQAVPMVGRAGAIATVAHSTESE